MNNVCVVRQKGFEPPTHALEGRCSIQLSYRRLSIGAGDGNRTHAASLEGWYSTIELHPHFNSFIIILHRQEYVNDFDYIFRNFF